MTVDLVLIIVAGVLLGCGIALLLERSLTRIVMGVVLLGNGVNLLILASGRPGGAPISAITPVDQMSDPLSQAMVLTAIVITLGTTAFLLAMAYRNWQFVGHDEVQDDVEDRRIMRMAARDETGEESGTDSTDAAEIEPARVVLRHGHRGGGR